MAAPVSRRAFLTSTSGLCLVPLTAPAFATVGQDDPVDAPRQGPPSSFPAQEADLVRATVGASHGNFEHVRTLVESRPALANATWDWGFGDWETALGAASHTGRIEIARFLMKHGARPDIFTCAMLGQLEAVEAIVRANPGVQRTPGPHGLTLMHHARSGGERAAPVVAYLETVGGADDGAASKPLSADERLGYLGVYAFGPTAADQLHVVESRNGMLGLKRGAEGTLRRLHNLGSHAFHPAGAPAVRIQFEFEGPVARRVTVLDPTPVVSAERVGAGASGT